MTQTEKNILKELYQKKESCQKEGTIFAKQRECYSCLQVKGQTRYPDNI